LGWLNLWERLICDKIGRGVLFVTEVEGKKRRIEGERGCWPGHKLNITDDITDVIHSRVNPVGNTIAYFYSICILFECLLIL
jgi:hypothetical protein